MPTHRRLERSTAGVTVVACLALLGTACGGSDSGSSSGTPSTPAPSSSASGASEPGKSQQALQTAGRTAEAKVPKGTLTSIETEAGGWEVQVVTPDGVEHELVLTADGSSVTRGPTTEHEGAADRAKHRARLKAAAVDYVSAAAAIAKAVPEGRITELNLDAETGRTVWEADVRTPDGSKHAVKVDASTGKVLRNVVDNDD